MELEQQVAGTFSYDPQRRIVELIWSDAPLDENAVKDMLVRFGEHAKAHPNAGLLVDARQFKFRWGPDMDSWRDGAVIPAYNEAGVRKFAFVVGDHAPSRPPAKMEPAAFETGWFPTRESAQDWLLDG